MMINEKCNPYHPTAGCESCPWYLPFYGCSQEADEGGECTLPYNVPTERIDDDE